MSAPLFYKDKPIFGFDIGHGTIKVMQIDQFGSKKSQVTGYGTIEFNPAAIEKGVITDPEEVAKQALKLFSSGMIGSITTKRVATALPVSSSYTRVVDLPPMDNKDLKEAIFLEVEQSVPVPVEQLYVDYEIARKAEDGSLEVLMVATPKKIVDSYISLFKGLDLEPAVVETTTSSVARIVGYSDTTSVPTLIIDFGTLSSDLAVYDQTIRVTGTTDWGGETLTREIAKVLKANPAQAQTIKTRYGLNAGKKQDEITHALQPVLDRLINEVRRISRFYSERAGNNQSISQIVILGGGANLPGLSTYLTDKIRIATRLLDPWQKIHFGKLQPPHKLENTLYSTAAGLSLIKGSDL